ncbi:MAG: 3-phosphoshikimate 1-carboxyvinyltransferase [Actinomycetota bacterium]
MKRLKKTRAPAPLTGSVTVPGDKSVSHRALILASLAQGQSRIGGLNDGADVRATADCLRALGVAVERSNGEVEVDGFAGAFAEPTAPLACGNSGTTMRTLAGVLAPAPGTFVLTGDESLNRRPMLRVVAPLRQMGAVIDGREHGDLPPLFVRGAELTGVDHELRVASAQVKTALLLAGLRSAGTTSVTEPAPSRDHTERMLAATGVEVERTGTRVAVQGGSRPDPFELTVPGDISAAAFLLVGALLLEGSELTVSRVGLNPTRTGFVEVLRAMGGDVEVQEEATTAGEPVGSVRAKASDLTAIRVEPATVPALIDEIPILAVAASQAEGETVFEGVGELRVKESDRLAAMAEGLTVLGADVEAGPQTLAVRGPRPLTGGAVDPRGDHRIAMAFAIAGLLSMEKVTVKGWSCVDVSFPGFLETISEARQ